MAPGKRGARRSSSSLATSTVTTIVLLVICVLGVWMFSNNFIAPSKSTDGGDDESTEISRDTEPEAIKTDEKSQHTSYEDNPGILPGDAVQSDETKQTTGANDNDRANPQEHHSTIVGVDEEAKLHPGIGGDGQSNTGEEEQVQKFIADENAMAGLRGKESAEEQKKQGEGDTQVSEESGLTQNQQVNDLQQQQQQQQPKQDLESIMKENEEMIKQQLQEDAGKETALQEPAENKIPDGDKQPGAIEHHPDEQTPHENKDGPFTKFTDETQKPSLQQELEAVTRIGNETTQLPLPETKKEEQIHESTKLVNEEQGESKRAREHKSNNPSQGDKGNTAGIPKESTESEKSWSTQASESEIEKQRRQDGESKGNESTQYTWHLCNETTGPDFIPCLDNVQAIKKLRTTMHYEHRERHCPEAGITCLVPLPEDYKTPISWPKSRDKVWYHNVPHTKLAQVKGHQNWVKVTGEFLTFPGGGTQFIHGALHYIDFIQKAVPIVAWGKRSRVVLDVGCGVASFGGYLFDRDALTMSFAPKDEHEAQVQFALERGIPAISAVMGTQRLPFPCNVFDVIHCARCRVPWHVEGGKLLLEANRVLRPGGYFVWSATPVYQKLEEDVQIWKAMSNATASICWELVTVKRDKVNSVGIAVYRKPTTNECYDRRTHDNPPMCRNDDDPNAAWYVPLQPCIHRVHVQEAERGSPWPVEWPARLSTPPFWLNVSQMGIYGKPAPQDFTTDYEHWKNVVSSSYMSGLDISWTNVRNVMDMRAVYGGFAAALKDLQVWVMNVVNVNSPDTLPIIYERGLFGIYHDWCESFSSYPRSYDLLHADHLFSKLKERCSLIPVMAEVDRLVRPGGKLIVRDASPVVGEVENLLLSLHWEIRHSFSKDQEGLLSAQKGNWRPETQHGAS